MLIATAVRVIENEKLRLCLTTANTMAAVSGNGFGSHAALTPARAIKVALVIIFAGCAPAALLSNQLFVYATTTLASRAKTVLSIAISQKEFFISRPATLLAQDFHGATTAGLIAENKEKQQWPR